MSNSINVLYEDKYIIAVIKPYGVLSVSDNTKISIMDGISDYLKSKGDIGFVGSVHRLDVTTGGVIVFAKTKQSLANMSSLVRDRNLHKTYYAVVSGRMENTSETLTDFLYHDRITNKTYVAKKQRKGVKKAKLSYDVISSRIINGDVLSLLKIKLYTGRTHQIRVQLAARQHPLAGDKKYGSTIHSNNIALWAYSLDFLHPVTNENIMISAAPCGDMFDIFSEEIGG